MHCLQLSEEPQLKPVQLKHSKLHSLLQSTLCSAKGPALLFGVMSYCSENSKAASCVPVSEGSTQSSATN